MTLPRVKRTMISWRKKKNNTCNRYKLQERIAERKIIAKRKQKGNQNFSMKINVATSIIFILNI